ncbi:hypothetical protein [Hungatella effluvii]|nr:hypothetical protein [Hungatella effluvii]
MTEPLLRRFKAAGIFIFMMLMKLERNGAPGFWRQNSRRIPGCAGNAG